MIGRTDMVEMLVAKYDHVDLLRWAADVIEALQQMRIIRR
jgi:hypothetical protein